MSAAKTKRQRRRQKCFLRRLFFCGKYAGSHNHTDILVEAKTRAERKLIDYRKNPPQPWVELRFRIFFDHAAVCLRPFLVINPHQKDIPRISGDPVRILLLLDLSHGPGC